MVNSLLTGDCVLNPYLFIYLYTLTSKHNLPTACHVSFSDYKSVNSMFI